MAELKSSFLVRAWTPFVSRSADAGAKQMRDLRDYLRAYWAYFSTSGWLAPSLRGLIWLAGMFAPLGARAVVELPSSVTIPWMIVWAVVGYIFAPYGMWKAQRKNKT